MSKFILAIIEFFYQSLSCFLNLINFLFFQIAFIRVIMRFVFDLSIRGE